MLADLPKVAVCFPSGDMVHADFALALASLCGSLFPIQPVIVNTKSSIVAAARNDAVRIAREAGVDYLLFLDSDMTFPNTTLHRLLAHRRPIVGALYTKRVPPYNLLGAPIGGGATIEAGGLIEMKHMPTGCLLIDMGVFAGLTPPYFRFLYDEATGEIHGEDYVFCDRARAAGFRIWCDVALSLEVGHIGQQICRFTEHSAPETLVAAA
jgi:glycosyltransferase involved in cell wall biosynthesis